MKDVAATLKRIDDEIVTRRQNIAYHQVEIARLEDTRKVLMSLAEDDIERAEQRRNPEHLSAPVTQSITVRKIGAEEGPPPSPHQANGHGERLNKRGDRRGMGKNDHDRSGHRTKQPKPRRVAADIPPDERQEFLRERVLVVLKSYGYPMDTADVRKAMGLEREWHKSRKVKALYNPITWLKKNGKIVRNDSDYTLSLPS